MTCAVIVTPIALAAVGTEKAHVGDRRQTPPSEEAPIALESGRVDPPAPAADRVETRPVPRIAQSGFISIQANVNASGLNALGDAANEPSIAVDPAAPNRMVIGWRQFDSIASNFRQAGYSYSVDGGRTWAAKQVIEPGIFRSDPVLKAGAGGVFHYSSLRGNFDTDLFTSTDGGRTWPLKSFSYGGDKQWIAVDTTGGIGHGHVYQAWSIVGNNYAPAQFNRSVDGGSTWQTPVLFEPDAADPLFPGRGQAAVGPDGAVYVAGIDMGGTAMLVVFKSISARDANAALAFEQLASVDLGGRPRLSTGPNPSGMLGQINIAVDYSGGPTAGNVYVLASIDPADTDPLDVMIATSTDGGATFGAPVRINDDAPDENAWQWFGTMSVAPNGRIDVIWNDTSESGQVNLSRLYYSCSMDGAATWSPGVPISPQFDSFVGWPNQNKLGDYYDMVSDNVGAHVIYAATFNGGQDVYYLRIGDYDCDGNGIGDLADIAAMTSPDCDGNGIPDACQVAAGASADLNENNIPDACEFARGDNNLDGVVNVADLLNLLAAWGLCPPPCPEDANGDGVVNVFDLLAVLANWD